MRNGKKQVTIDGRRGTRADKASGIGGFAEFRGPHLFAVDRAQRVKKTGVFLLSSGINPATNDGDCVEDQPQWGEKPRVKEVLRLVEDDTAAVRIEPITPSARQCKASRNPRRPPFAG